MTETVKRSIVKAFSWRIIATLTTIALVWIVSGNMTAALSVGVLDVVAKLIFYYFHERAWTKITWGRKK